MLGSGRGLVSQEGWESKRGSGYLGGVSEAKSCSTAVVIVFLSSHGLEGGSGGPRGTLDNDV